MPDLTLTPGLRTAVRRVGLCLAIAAGLFVAAVIGTARSGDRSLWPPAAGAPATEVFVVSHGYHAWAAARAADDFPSYVPVLEKNLELARREAAYLGRADAHDTPQTPSDADAPHPVQHGHKHDQRRNHE